MRNLMSVNKAKEFFGKDERGQDNVAKTRGGENWFALITGIIFLIVGVAILFVDNTPSFIAPVAIIFAIVCLGIGFFYRSYYLLNPQELLIKEHNAWGIVLLNPKTGVTHSMKNDYYKVIDDEQRSETVVRFGRDSIECLRPILVMGNDGLVASLYTPSVYNDQKKGGT